MGVILLAGGAEFTGQMADPDKAAIQLAGGLEAPIRVLPTAAAPDNNHQRAAKNGVSWFKQLGATNASSLPVIDKASANDPAISERLSNARLIYLLGGFPQYLAQTLSGSLSWQAILSAHQAGAVIAGSSAGAMVLCEYYYDPQTSQVLDGLNLLSGICILPHHNTFGKTWAAPLGRRLPNIVLIGIDEETGVICDLLKDVANVRGKGHITVYNNDQIETIGPNQDFTNIIQP